MIKHFMKRLLFITALITTILGITLACQLFSFGREQEVSRIDAHYTINPDSILESLAQGRINVFRAQVATPEAESSSPGKPVRWSQSDYFQIAQALQQMDWNESLEDWSFGSMMFGMDCQDIDYGPQHAYFGFYKVEPRDKKYSRLVHEIYILHQVNSVSWVQTEYFPQLENWKTLDMTLIKVSVNDALQIAEKNGGYETRLSVENQCKIVLSLAPGAEYDGWQVLYSSDHSLFLIHIDPFSGTYQVMDIKP